MTPLSAFPRERRKPEARAAALEPRDGGAYDRRPQAAEVRRVGCMRWGWSGAPGTAEKGVGVGVLGRRWRGVSQRTSRTWGTVAHVEGS